MNLVEEFYNKFNEDKRLNSRHGRVEYILSMEYIHKYLPTNRPKGEIKIADIGAGTGRYSIPLFEEGYDVTAVELVNYNLGIMKQKCPALHALKGNATNLKRKLKDDTYDVTLLFGPMYHLCSAEDKMKALAEAKRVTKPGGVILVAYIMNEYMLLTYSFVEQHILEVKEKHRLTEDYNIVPHEKNIYYGVRIEEIDHFNQTVGGVQRKVIFSPDGPANHMRQVLNALSEEEFEIFVDYQRKTCERADLIGAGGHTVDVLRKI